MQNLIRELNLSVGGNPLSYRTDTDDLEILCSILIRQEYGCVGEDVREPKLIVDCGAYAGYSTAYFLTTYPSAHIIALEPDDRNLELCRLNLGPYAGRVNLIKAAIWPEAMKLALRKNELAGVQREWATVVGPPRGDEPAQTVGIDFATLLRESGFAEIDLVKLNVCGIEEQLFSQNCEAWLPHVKNIVIRPLNEELESTLLRALADYQFFLARGTGLFAFTRISAKAPPPKEKPSSTGTGNAIANGGFENLRVGPGRVVPGRWMCDSNDVAVDWQIAVCDPQFRVSLAVRTGLQHSGDTALYVGMNSDTPILPHSAPYAAIENNIALPVREGDDWHIRAFVKTADNGPSAKGVRGAYVFLRLSYEDGSFTDLRTEPLLEVTGEYVTVGGIVSVPVSARGGRIERATLWLYAWIENHEAVETSTAAYCGWEVFFDDVYCSKLSGLADS